MHELSIEMLHPDFQTALRIDRMLYDSRSEHQRIRVFENAIFGRVMTLDGVIQTTEADEFIYHEMICHVPILAHGAVRRVLIIGGGDGGVAREVLRHAGIEHVTMVEIDASVVDFTRTYLPSVWADAFSDPRLQLVIADGAAFVSRPPQGRYDVIIVDSTDPVGPGEVLFSDAFYTDAKTHLQPGGIMVTQNGVVFLQKEELASTMRSFRALFADASCYLAAIPTYTGGPLAFGWGTDGNARHVDPDVLANRFAAANLGCRYYTPEVHLGAFALPGYVQAAMIG
jgi:spermidine synthase